MNDYLTHDHPDAFVDWPERTKSYDKGYKPCPLCKGLGGWNLKLNAYPLHRYENTAENRHHFSHFRCCCSHCNGWGQVLVTEACVGHEWKWVKNTGKCLNLFECVHCGKKSEVDSSD